MRILLVASAPPEPHGSGWNRRVYQIQKDLKTICNAEVEVFDAGRAIKELLPERPNSPRSMLGRAGARYLRDQVSNAPDRLLSNPLRILTLQPRFSTSRLRGSALALFRDFLKATQPFDAVVCDNPLFSNAVRLMAAQGVPGYYVLHHIESLHTGLTSLLDVTQGSFRGSGRPTKHALITCANLADEIAALACARRVFTISRFEQEVLAATGLQSEFYPYQPTGKTLDWCETIRRRRIEALNPKQVVFLSSGTATGHNEHSLSIVLRELMVSGLPPNSELVVTGVKETLLTASDPKLHGISEIHGISFAGMLAKDRFDHLLASVAALVIPKYCGFGFLTRFADASACGIPVITNAPESISGLNNRQAYVVERMDLWPEALAEFAQRSSSNHAITLEPRPPIPHEESPLQQIRLDYLTKCLSSRSKQGDGGEFC